MGGYRDQWGYAEVFDTRSLPANDATGASLAEIDVTGERIVGVVVNCSASFEWVLAATSTAADTAFAAKDAMRQRTADLDVVIPTKVMDRNLYIRGLDNASSTADALSYYTLNAGG